MALVLGSELVPKGSLPAIKKIQADSAVVALAMNRGGGIVGCGACVGHVEEGVVGEHAGAYSPGEFFDLFFDVREEGV